ncbi:hypothetical protein [Pseudomonas aeruginosa]|uniref:hypothetical protein n=1 Tax=Pseudomonas aeruginosa TaxID=287 RepID=UPI0018E1FBFD|nr:hypothetical protein [Pseudomonas aeruginosa]
MSKELNKAPVEQAEPASCQGTNCGTTTGDHSSECLAEAAASQGWELKPGDLCGRDCPMRPAPVEQAGGDERASKPGLFCRDCGSRLMVRGVCSIYCPNCVKAQVKQAEAERPEVFGLERYRVEKTGQGFWPYCVRAGDGTRELFAGHLKQCKRVAAQLATAFEDGKFVAGALRAENAKLSEALDRWPLIRDSLKLRLADALARVAALESKLAELEKQEPVAWGAFHFGGKRDGKLYTHCETEAQIDAYILDMHRSSDSLTLRKSPLYAAPFAQNQPTVPDGYALIPARETEAMHDAVMALLYKGVARTDTQKLLDAYIAAAPGKAQHSVPDHAELLQALERTHAGHMVGHDQSDQPKGGYSDGYVNGFGECIKVARKALAASPAQAQHSVPEGWMLVECGIWTQEQVDEMQKTVARFRNSEFVDDRALAMAVADAGQCKAPEISLAELLAGAPGKEVGHE